MLKIIKEIIEQEVLEDVTKYVIEEVLSQSGYERGLQKQYLESKLNHTDWDAVIDNVESEIYDDSSWIDGDMEMILEEAEVTSLNEFQEKHPEKFIDFCYDYGVSPSDYEHEIYEYYVITDWLHQHLIEIGYPVSEFKGLNIMCRYTTGQSMSIDGFWGQVLDNIK